MDFHRIPAVPIFISFAAGIVFSHYIPLPIWLMAMCTGIGVAYLFSTLLFSRLSKYYFPAVYILFLSLGICTEALHSPFGMQYLENAALAKGQVVKSTDLATGSSSLVNITALKDSSGTVRETSFSTYLYSTLSPPARGSEIVFPVRIKKENSGKIPALHLYRDDKISISTPVENSGPQRFVREKIFSSTLSPSSKQLLSALITGDREALTTHTTQTYSEAGIIHILAISGLHIGIIGMIIYFLFRPLVFLNRRIPMLLGILGVWGFVWFTGGTVSAVRAAVMFSIAGFAIIMERTNNPLNALAVAGLIILVINPDELFSPGFQLSFAAVLVIILSSPLAEIIIPRHQYPRIFNLISLLIVALAAQLATLPIVAYYFHHLPLASLPLNLLIIPAMPFILGLSLAYTGGLIFGVDFPPLSWMIDHLIDFLNSATEFVAFQKLAVKDVNIHFIVAIIAFCAVISIAMLLLHPKKAWLQSVSAALFLFFGISLFLFEEPLPQNIIKIYPSAGNLQILSSIGGKEEIVEFPATTPSETNINNKKIVYLNHKLSSTHSSGAKECDILILGTLFRTSVEDILSNYRPQEICIAAGTESNRTKKIQKECNSLGIDCRLITYETPLEISAYENQD